MNKRSSWITRLAGALALLAPATQAHAGGFTLVDRGARGLSRGGAFVAGADDPSALWYNPAALDESKNQILSDATLTVMLVDYQRQYRDGSYSAEVTGKPMYLPIPTLAMSHKFGLRHFTFAAGIFAPNMVLNNWPRSVKENGINVPAPQRYSLISLQGSIYSNLAAGLAWHPTKSFSIGADAQVSIGRLKTEVALSGCGDGLTCNFPEDPQYDVYSTADVLPAWGVTGVFGVKYNAGNILRLGASVMLPYKLQGPASLSNRLPNNALFENASVSGDKADFSMQFPLIVRVGSEIRPFPAVRLEGAFVWEQWSSQKSIDITPQDVSIRNIRGIGDYDVGPIKLVRNMNDVWSLRGGYEIFIPPRFMPIDFLRKTKFAMRGGLAYEKSAFTNKTLTPFTLDSDKVLLTGGFALNLTKTLRFESAAGWYFMKNVTVTESTIPRPMAIRPQSTADNVTQGNGIYKMEAFYLGGGFTLYLDDTGPRT
jgi:long-chain fatty acid transport protein